MDGTFDFTRVHAILQVSQATRELSRVPESLLMALACYRFPLGLTCTKENSQTSIEESLSCRYWQFVPQILTLENYDE